MPLSRILGIWRKLAAHPLNDGISSAARRWIMWQARARISRTVTLRWVNGLTLTGRHGMISISMQAYNGLHELRDMCFATHLLDENDLFFDIGANIGVYSLLISKTAGARGVAFEPVPESADFLALNLEKNSLSDRVVLRRAAVSDAPGAVRMSVAQDVMNKIIDADAPEASVEVPAVTIDSEAAQTPTLIKIDVEGFEPGVIAGAQRVLRDPACLAVIVEINDNASADGAGYVLNALRSAGFEETDYDPKTRALRPIDASDGPDGDNRLFIRAAAREVVAERLKGGRPIHVRNKIF